MNGTQTCVVVFATIAVQYGIVAILFTIQDVNGASQSVQSHIHLDRCDNLIIEGELFIRRKDFVNKMIRLIWATASVSPLSHRISRGLIVCRYIQSLIQAVWSCC